MPTPPQVHTQPVPPATAHLIAVGLALLLAGCATPAPPAPAAVDVRTACAAMTVPVPAAVIGLPSGGAQIVAAEWVMPTPLVVPASGRFVPAAPAHCRLRGRVEPPAADAAPIDFMLALPETWNGNALQFGDDGLDTLPFDGRAPLPAARIDRPGPLARGFATYGVIATASGAVGSEGPPPGDAALIDLAHAAHKKVHDAVVWLIQQRHGRAPQRVYFAGSSEGGRAALAMAQRYPADFDGVFARAPLVQWTGLQHARWRAGIAQMDGGWLRPAQVRWWAETVRLACDALDGLADGIVGAQEACGHVLRADLLRCPEGAPAGDWCLADRQLQAVQALLQPYRFDLELAHGLRSHPGWPMGGEDAPPAGPAGGWLAWWSGLQPPSQPPGIENGLGWQQASAALGRWIVRDPGFDLRRYEPGRHAARLRQVSAQMDTTDPDLSKFAARGGKLLMIEPMADAARSPRAGIEYFQSVIGRMGLRTVEGFARLYLAVGVDHVGQGGPGAVDMLDVMVDWVEHGRAPGPLEVLRQQAAPPHGTLRSLPLCPWPMFPRYLGEGSPDAAASFACAER